VVNADGTDMKQLTFDQARDYSGPTWSPDGQYLLVSTNNGAPNGTLFVLKADGSSIQPLTYTPPTLGRMPNWSRAAAQVALVSSPTPTLTPSQIPTLTPTITPSPTPTLTPTVTLTPSLIPSITPTFTPTTSPFVGQGKITFSSNRDGSVWRIFVMNADGTDIRNLTPESYDNTDPAWSPDGSKIAFVSTRDGNEEIYVMNADGSNQRRVTVNNVLDLSPSWAPSGDKLVYASNLGGFLQLWQIDIDGKNRKRISELKASEPAWSPDGQYIACVCEVEDEQTGIYVLGADGLSYSRIADGTSPAWSPDSQYIAYATSKNQPGIHIVHMSGDLDHFVISRNSVAAEPAWSPDGKTLLFSANGGIYAHVIDGEGVIIMTFVPDSRSGKADWTQ
jgi:Tol biopolymer transport system component